VKDLVLMRATVAENGRVAPGGAPSLTDTWWALPRISLTSCICRPEPGRAFDRSRQRQCQKVCVVGATVAPNYSPTQDPLGRR